MSLVQPPQQHELQPPTYEWEHAWMRHIRSTCIHVVWNVVAAAAVAGIVLRAWLTVGSGR